MIAAHLVPIKIREHAQAVMTRVQGFDPQHVGVKPKAKQTPAAQAERATACA